MSKWESTKKVRLELVVNVNDELLSSFVNHLYDLKAGSVEIDRPGYEQAIDEVQGKEPCEWCDYARFELALFLMFSGGKFESADGLTFSDWTKGDTDETS